jgi:hypothetical protein
MNELPDDPNAPRLGPHDAAALDRLVERGFTDAEGDGEEARRERAVLEALRMLDAYPVEASDPSLIDATLARIDAAEREQAARMRVERAPQRSARWADIGGIAAVLLLAAGVTWPALARMRDTALKTACANNLRAMGAGLASYAHDHRDFLPMTAGLGGLTAPQPTTLDWNTYEHGGNLVALARQGYCGMQQVQCPACAAGAPHQHHFAFRLPAADRAFRLTIIGRGALVADANPVIELRRAGRPVAANLASWNHAQSGQNVLFGDGALLWLTRPEVDGDNIYLPRGVAGPDLMPNMVELPFGSDAFLVH